MYAYLNGIDAICIPTELFRVCVCVRVEAASFATWSILLEYTSNRVYCCEWATRTELSGKLDKFACINFYRLHIFTTLKSNSLPFSLSLCLPPIFRSLCNPSFRRCETYSYTRFKFQSFFSLFGAWFVSLQPQCVLAQMFKHQSIDAMHTKSVCSIKLVCPFTCYSFTDVSNETRCSRYLSSFKWLPVGVGWWWW